MRPKTFFFKKVVAITSKVSAFCSGKLLYTHEKMGAGNAKGEMETSWKNMARHHQHYAAVILSSNPSDTKVALSFLSGTKHEAEVFNKIYSKVLTKAQLEPITTSYKHLSDVFIEWSQALRSSQTNLSDGLLKSVNAATTKLADSINANVQNLSAANVRSTLSAYMFDLIGLYMAISIKDQISKNKYIDALQKDAVNLAGAIIPRSHGGHHIVPNDIVKLTE